MAPSTPTQSYDVRVTRLTGDSDEERNFGKCIWNGAADDHRRRSGAGVRRHDDRRAHPRAPGSCRGRSTSSTSTRGPSPATGTPQRQLGLAADRLAGGAVPPHAAAPGRRKPATDAQIDLARLAYWDGVTRPAGRVFNGVFDSQDLALRRADPGRSSRPGDGDAARPEVLGGHRRAEDRAGADVHAAQQLELRGRDDARAGAARLPHRLRQRGGRLEDRGGGRLRRRLRLSPTPR